MSRRTTVAGLLGCALLAAPVSSASQGPSALPPVEAAADSTSATAAVSAPDATLPDPVVVPASTGSRSWASGTAPTGVAPDRLSTVVLDAYTRAAALAPQGCRLTVPLLAAIGQVESGNLVGRTLDETGRVTPAIVGPRLDGGAFRAVKDTDKGQLDGDKKFDRALGPLQFLPSTWRSVGVDLDDDGARDPQSIYDAAGGAMVFLCDEGRDLSDAADLRDAVLSYNRSQAYLAQVLRWKADFEDAELSQLAPITSVPGFGSWQVGGPATPTPAPVDVSAAVRPAPAEQPTTASTATGSTGSTGSGPAPSGPAGPTHGGTPTTTPTGPGKPTTPITTPTGPGTPTTTPTGPTGPSTPTTAPGDPATPSPSDPGSTTPDPEPSTDPKPTPEPSPEPTPEPGPTVIPALSELAACVEPTDPELPPAPVDEDTHPLLTLGEEEGTVVMPDGVTVVTVGQLCLGTPES